MARRRREARATWATASRLSSVPSTPHTIRSKIDADPEWADRASIPCPCAAPPLLVHQVLSAVGARIPPPGCGHRLSGSRWPRHHRVQIELDDLVEVGGELRQPANEIGQRGRVGRRRARASRPAAHPPCPRRRAGRVDVGERRGCEPDLAQELGHRATHPERDDRPEHGSCIAPAITSTPPRTIGWITAGNPTLVVAAASSAGVRTSSTTPPSRSCARPPRPP